MKIFIIKTFGRLIAVLALLAFSASVHGDDIWFRKLKSLARAGNADAQYKVAVYYMKRGIYDSGIEWYITAAENGQARAEYELADMYMKGDKVPQSIEKALYWYQQSAQSGFVQGQVKLGTMYMNGGVVKKDLVQAYRWLRSAAAQGNTEALEEVNELEDRMSMDQVEEAEALLAKGK